MRSYRKPDGTPTADVQEYGRAWKVLIDKAEAFFRDYRVAGYDPDLQMTKRNPTTADYWKNTTFSLTVEAVKNLRAPDPEIEICERCQEKCPHRKETP